MCAPSMRKQNAMAVFQTLRKTIETEEEFCLANESPPLTLNPKPFLASLKCARTDPSTTRRMAASQCGGGRTCHGTAPRSREPWCRCGRQRGQSGPARALRRGASELVSERLGWDFPRIQRIQVESPRAVLKGLDSVACCACLFAP